MEMLFLFWHLAWHSVVEHYYDAYADHTLIASCRSTETVTQSSRRFITHTVYKQPVTSCIDPILIVIFYTSFMLNLAVHLAPWITVNASYTQRKALELKKQTKKCFMKNHQNFQMICDGITGSQSCKQPTGRREIKGGGSKSFSSMQPFACAKKYTQLNRG